jgi:7-carboxy-7-deazaguanine synthase
VDTVEVIETFTSIQGESTYAGLPCFFIRLAGCNLRCRYCDTPQAMSPGRKTRVGDLVMHAKASGASIVEITGGEPLLQAGFRRLAIGLRDRVRKPVLVETNGSRDISVIPAGVVAVMDIKCPGSGQSRAMDPGNLRRLRPQDEVKFVIGSRADYEWARNLARRHAIWNRCHAVLLGPVWGKVKPERLAEWILDDALPVRLQIQWHKVLNLR